MFLIDSFHMTGKNGFLFFGYLMLGLLQCAELSADSYIPKYNLTVQQSGSSKLYNGVYPGPIMRVSPGESLDVRLTNSLPALNDDCADNMNQVHGENTTNLHPHGLHVSPGMDSSGKYYSDNVFVSLVPQDQIVECEGESHASGHHGMAAEYVWGSANYRFELPDDHMTGTFWYHAHKHGSTEEQVADGLAGPLIVEDKPGYMPDYIVNANERVFVIGNNGLYLADEAGGGVLSPTILIAPGEVQRWRIINAMGNGRRFRLPRLSLRGLEVYLIAYDGFTLRERIPLDFENYDKPWLNPAALSSGNRLDLIVHAPLTYKELKNPEEAPRQSLFSSFFNGPEITSAVDFNVQLAGHAVDMVWSENDALPGSGLKAFMQKELGTRELSFTPRNTIDGESFNGSVKQTLKIDTAEEWTVNNVTQQLHIYHIHVNPFFITHINGEELAPGSPLRRWQDTIGIAPRQDGVTGSVKFRTRYENFTGRFVIHCHVLAHEDQGMMQIVEVVED